MLSSATPYDAAPAQWTSGRRNLLILGALMCFLAVCGAVFLIWGLVGAVHRA